MKDIILKYKEKADSDSRIKELYDLLKEGAKEVNTGIEVRLKKDRYYDQIYIRVSGEGGFTVRYIDGVYQVGRNDTTTLIREAYRLSANKLGAIIYGSVDRDY